MSAALVTEDYRRLNAELHASRADYGVGGVKWAPQIVQLQQQFRAASILDYGCGKGTLGAALSHLIVLGYDPAIPHLAEPPDPHDLVVCTDVLEHIEPDCLDAVLDDLRRVTIKGIFLTVATRPAKKFLADGRNAHLIQESAAWWLPKIMSRFDLRVFNATEGEFACVGIPRRSNGHA